MILTVIGYKPNSSDYCRGCLMASYGSDFKFGVYPDDREGAVQFAAQMLSYDTDMGEDGYNVILLIDGKAVYGDGLMDYCEHDPSEVSDEEDLFIRAFTHEANQRAGKIREARKVAREAEKKREEEEDRAASAAAERATYERLKQKFEQK
jgi:hypothetical protein